VLTIALALALCIRAELITDNSESGDSEVTTKKTTKVERSWRTRYYRCVKSKKIVIPIPVYQNAYNDKCEEELEESRTALEGIKSWCDPYCRGELEDCIEALQLIDRYSHYNLFEEI